MNSFCSIVYLCLSNIYCIMFFLYFINFKSIKINKYLFITYLIIVNSLVCYASTFFLYPLQMAGRFLFVLITALLFYNSSWIQKLFASSIYTFILLCSQGTINSIYALANRVSFHTLLTNIDMRPYVSLISITFAICVFLLFIRVCPINKIAKAIENKYAMSVITAAVFIFCLFLNFMTFIYYANESILIIPGYHLALSVVFLISYLALFCYIIDLDMVERIQSKNEILENQLATQRVYYRKNMEYISALRKIKHDYLNLLHSLEYAFIDYSKEELENMINELLQKTKTIDQAFTQYSNDPLVDSIILDASLLCKSKEIKLTSLISIPEDLPFDEDDLCVIFATLLNTSIALSDQTNIENKSISLTNTIRSGWFMINCEIKSNENQDISDAYLTHSNFKLVHEIVDSNSGFIETKKEQDIYKIQICIAK